MPASASARRRPPNPTSTRSRSWPPPRSPAPTRSIRATAFCPRTPTSPRWSIEHGFAFIGPKPEHIRLMGDKVAAKDAMRRLGVPVVPGHRRPGRPTRSMAREAALRIGYPVLIKAVAGGGGRGMVVAQDEAELLDGLRLARREAAGGLRRRPGLSREVPRAAAPHRDPAAGRRARHLPASRRARLLGPAAPPEGDRGGALDASLDAADPRPLRRARRRRDRRGSATAASAPPSSSTRTASSTSSR